MNNWTHPIPFERAARIIEAVVSHFRRRGVRYDIDEMRQEAWVGLLESLRTFDPGRNDAKISYVWRAAFRSLAKALWKRIPVSVRYYDFKEANENVKVVKFDLNTIPEDLDHRQDTIVDRKLLAARIRDLVVESLAIEDELIREVASLVLLGSSTTKKIAEMRGVTISKVRIAARKAKRVLANDDKITRLWEEAKC